MGKSRAMGGRGWLIILFAILTMAPIIRADPETRQLEFGCSTVPSNNITLFAKILKKALAHLEEHVVPSGFAAINEVWATDLVDSVYAVGQCRKDKSPADCAACMKVAIKQVSNCTKVTGGRANYDGCFVRFENYNFFSTSFTDGGNAPLSGPTSNSFSATPRRRKQASSTAWIIIGVVAGVFILGLFTCLLLFRKKIMRSSQKQEIGTADTEVATELRRPGDFDFKILKKATNNFDKANKLGQGGFGEVFKGSLENGKIVAIKKLKFGGSAHAISEFESEVKLISNVHDKNLVRLLGYCRQGQERLLIYEYMPNGSLDRILSGKNERLLSLKERLDIVVGTARGLAYLHEKFHVCIIHRDIKSSNILLDENFQPKIADFGLARLLPDDKSHVNTRFAGTLGYTAPEYASNGQLTKKADTYSFGVVVLEIVSGRKSIDLNQPPHMQYLLEWVWNLYEEDNVLEVVGSEEKMEGYNEEEVARLINLALLCLQASPDHRPSMSDVVTILLSKAEIGFQKPFVENRCLTPTSTVNARVHR